ncbi:hypothetical protein ACFQ1O_03595 [Pseudofulvibacter geojedonensis]|uniref:Uncharacterized protein n=2 Tax=Pseudofulvibacter geojedonensis TaxID=1123758 RepID=A0ABW3I025_9FLAO
MLNNSIQEGSFRLVRLIKSKSRLLSSCLLLLSLFLGFSQDTNSEKKKKGKTYLRGNIALDYNYFNKEPFKESQLSHQLSTLITGEFKYVKGKFKFVAQPHIRLDAIDSYRTHADMRNLYVSYWNKNLTINAGMRLFTLGKFTGFSLVDIMNRMDIKESILSFEKLGQPSIDFKYIYKKISAELYVMPYFRKVNFNAGDSRLLLVPFPIDGNNPQYDHNSKEFLPNVSVRVGAKKENNEVVLGYFYGYNKNPDFVFQPSKREFSELYLTMSQWSLEWQTLYKGLTFTSEFINQTYRNNENFFGLHIALGYDISKLYQGASTMNISVEYVHDKYRIRKNLPFGNNFITLYTFNLGDINDTTFRAKVFSSKDVSYHFFDMDISRRIFSEFKVSGKMSFSSGSIAQTDPLYINNFNTYYGLQIGWFF